jgi:hypothetical protein
MKVYFRIDFSYFFSTPHSALKNLLGRISVTFNVTLQNFMFVSPFIYISVLFQMSFLEMFRRTENTSSLLVCCV